jgi:hypothetical protein
VRWCEVTSPAIDRAWKRRDADRVVDLRHPDGSPFLTVDRDDELGFRIWSPGHGRHLVGPDGSTILSALPRRPGLRWQRLFFAQALPLAAALQGLELFHASAVELAGRAVCFVARSGAGKTSLALQLAARGAPLLTDDVLALEPSGDEVLAHPGAGVANVDADQWRRLPRAKRRAIGRSIGRSDKVHLHVDLTPEARPLRLVYFLQRVVPDAPAAISSGPAADGSALLGSGFLVYLRSPERLAKHLDLCACVAAATNTFTVEVPSGGRPETIAELVEEHALTQLGKSRS